LQKLGLIRALALQPFDFRGGGAHQLILAKGPAVRQAQRQWRVPVELLFAFKKQARVV